MNPKRRRRTPDLTATVALAAQHLTLKRELRLAHGPAAHSFVVTSNAQLYVYDAAGQEMWPARTVSDDQLLTLAQDAAALHSFGHWLLDDLADLQTCGEWRVIPQPHILNLPW